MEFFTVDDGARIAYLDQGTGVPVLALSGLTRTVQDFDYVAPHLDGIRLIRMDYRGRGKSDWTGQTSYSVPREGADAIQLLDHLGLKKAAILGSSRGGLIAMYLASTVKDRLSGLCLNDVGPVLEQDGLDKIFDYIGRNPTAKTHAEMAAKLPAAMTGFANVPEGRWLSESEHHYIETAAGLTINYDPALREAFLAAFKDGVAEAWPLFDACADLPLALIHGANSDLLCDATVAKMRAQRPDMIYTAVPERAHIPFLDEPQSLATLRAWIAKLN